MDNKNQILYYRKSGHFVEFKDLDKEYWFYVIKKALSWITDSSLFIAVLFLLYMVLKLNILNTTLIIMALSFLYNLGMNSLFEGKTIGMLIANLQVIRYDGQNLDKWTQYIVRSFISSMYTVIIFSPFMLVFNILSAIFNRSLTCVDLMSKTQVVSKHTYRHLKNILPGIEKR